MGVLGGCQIWDSKIDYLFEREPGDAGSEAVDTGQEDEEVVLWTGELEFVVALEGQNPDTAWHCGGYLNAEQRSEAMEGTGSVDCVSFIFIVNFAAELDPSGGLSGLLWSEQFGEALDIDVSAARTDGDTIEAELSGGGDDPLLGGGYIISGTMGMSRE